MTMIPLVDIKIIQKLSDDNSLIPKGWVTYLTGKDISADFKEIHPSEFEGKIIQNNRNCYHPNHAHYSLEDLKYPEVGEVFYRRFSDKDLEKIGKTDYTSTKIPKDYPEAVVINQFYIGDATVFYGNNKSLDWNSFSWLFSRLKLEE